MPDLAPRLSTTTLGSSPLRSAGRWMVSFLLAWPPALAAYWAIGWLVTIVAGISVDQQFIVFGSSGAVVVTALTIVLPLTLNRTAAQA